MNPVLVTGGLGFIDGPCCAAWRGWVLTRSASSMPRAARKAGTMSGSICEIPRRCSGSSVNSISPPWRTESIRASKAADWMLFDTLHRVEGLPLITLRLFSTYGPCERAEKLVPYVMSHVHERGMLPRHRANPQRKRSVWPGVQHRRRSTDEPLGKRQLSSLESEHGFPCSTPLANRAWGTNRYSSPTPPKAEQYLGWSPTVSMADGMGELIE